MHWLYTTKETLLLYFSLTVYNSMLESYQWIFCINNLLPFRGFLSGVCSQNLIRYAFPTRRRLSLSFSIALSGPLNWTSVLSFFCFVCNPHPPYTHTNTHTDTHTPNTLTHASPYNLSAWNFQLFVFVQTQLLLHWKILQQTVLF